MRNIEIFLHNKNIPHHISQNHSWSRILKGVLLIFEIKEVYLIQRWELYLEWCSILKVILIKIEFVPVRELFCLFDKFTVPETKSRYFYFKLVLYSTNLLWIQHKNGCFYSYVQNLTEKVSSLFLFFFE